jgi:fimbrial chaperone protein
MLASMRRLRVGRVARVVFGGLLFAAGAAKATGGLSVNPVVLNVTSTAPTAVVRLRNEDSSGRRYEITALAWSESPDGQMKLAPTTEVLFFPALFLLKPGEERVLRVATGVPAGPTERSYRLFIEELPPEPGRGGEAGAVRVRTRIGLPLFVAASSARPAAVLTSPAADRDGVSFSLENKGNSHLRFETITCVGRGEAGEVLFERSFPGWYLLAGGRRDYRATVPEAACRRLRSLTVRALPETGSGAPPVEAHRPLPSGACGG